MPCRLGRSAFAFPKSLADFPKSLAVFRNHRQTFAPEPGDPQCLPAIEALAGIYRDRSQYADAEPRLERAVRMREASDGLDTAELIPSVDSLAYVEFGLQDRDQTHGVIE